MLIYLLCENPEVRPTLEKSFFLKEDKTSFIVFMWVVNFFLRKSLNR